MPKRIYCGNLSFQATEDEVRSLFEPHGEVTSVHMVMDRETGRARGFAFVEMADDQAAAAAIQALDGQRHLERNLKVNEAQPREERGGGGGRRRRSRRRWRRRRCGGGRGGWRRAAAASAAAAAPRTPAAVVRRRRSRWSQPRTAAARGRRGPGWRCVSTRPRRRVISAASGSAERAVREQAVERVDALLARRARSGRARRGASAARAGRSRRPPRPRARRGRAPRPRRARAARRRARRCGSGTRVFVGPWGSTTLSERPQG